MNIVQTTYHGGYEGLGGAWGEFIGMIKAAGHRTVDGLYEILCGRPGGERGSDHLANGAQQGTGGGLE